MRAATAFTRPAPLRKWGGAFDETKVRRDRVGRFARKAGMLAAAAVAGGIWLGALRDLTVDNRPKPTKVSQSQPAPKWTGGPAVDDSVVTDLESRMRSVFPGSKVSTNSVTQRDGSVLVDFQIADDDSRTEITRIYRRNDAGDLIVKHDMFETDSQRSGVAKRVIAEQFDQYRQLGAKRVELYANLDVGAYAWARFGFVPEDGQWADLRDRIAMRVDLLAAGDEQGFKKTVRAQAVALDFDRKHTPPPFRRLAEDEVSEIRRVLDVPDPRAVWALADHPAGRSLLMGLDWDGRIDLSDEIAVGRLDRYIAK